MRENKRGNKSETKYGFNMIYISFSQQSNKILPNMICNKYKHCAPVVIKRNKCFMYQFTSQRNICIICLNKKDLQILKQYGWVFVKYNNKINLQNCLYTKSLTCVQFTKKFCNIKKLKIQTPDSLLKYIS